MGKINWLDKLRWNEEHIEDLRYTGYSYVRQGKYEIALPFFEALMILDPTEAYDSQTVAAILMQLDRPKDAMKYFDKALSIDSKHGPTLINLAKAFFMLGKKEEGLRVVNNLKTHADSMVSNMAKALMMAYS